MSSRGTGLTLSLGILAAIAGYFLWQSVIGINTKVDDVGTILTNSAAGSTNLQISFILICVGLVVHAAGLINTRGTAPGTSESLGIVSIVAAIVLWVTSSGAGIALAEMGEKYVATAGAGDAATAGSIAVAAGFAQSATVAANSVAGLLAGIGWMFMGLAYRSSDAKGALSFIPLGWLALIMGLILVVSTLLINTLVSIELGSQISGIAFLLIVLWSVLRGVTLIRS